MRSLRINGFKTEAPYTTVHFRCITCNGKDLIGYFDRGPREKIYRIFTAMMVIVVYVCYRK